MIRPKWPDEVLGMRARFASLLGVSSLLQLSVDNPQSPPTDSGYSAIGVHIAVFHSSTQSITELGAINSASSVGVDMEYFLDSKTHAWMLTILKDDTGTFQVPTTMSTNTRVKLSPPGAPTTTMGGLPIFPGAARFAADSIVPLSPSDFIVVTTEDPGGWTNQNYLAHTITAADPQAGTPAGDQAQRETIQKEALLYAATGTVIQTPTAVWFKDDGHVYDHYGDLLSDANPATFAPLSQDGPGSEFAIDGVHAYSQENGEIPGADAATFKVLDLNFEKDASHVFLGNSAIPGADASTFVVTGPGPMGKGSQHVYDCRDGNLKIDGRVFSKILLSASNEDEAVGNQAKNSANGYVVLTIKRTVSTGSQMMKSATQTQTFKIALDSTFFSQFTQPPSATLFYCTADDRSNGSSLRFLQYFQQEGGKVTIWVWGEGTENVNGAMVSVHNGKARMDATFPSWETLDSGDTINVDGGSAVVSVNFASVSIAARYVPQFRALPGNPRVDDPALQGALLAPINGVDGHALVTGDAQDGLSLAARCGFQKN
jgi:DKNYY family